MAGITNEIILTSSGYFKTNYEDQKEIFNMAGISAILTIDRTFSREPGTVLRYIFNKGE